MQKTLLMLSAAFLAVFSLFGMRLPEPVSTTDARQVVRQELNFSHRLHIEENGLACDDCHESATASSTGADNLLPPMESCQTCHDIEDPETCATCHVDGDNPDIVPRIVDYSQKFSHALHDATGLSCETCHEDVALSEDSRLTLLPGMVSCTTCHEDAGARNECLTCHLPGENLKPASHVLGFQRAHGDLARTGAVDPGGMTCQTCHSNDFCQDCHEGENLDRTTHPLNFAFTHALEAQANKQNCITCHTEQQFCIDCHRDNFVLPHDHGPGWAIRPGGGRHKREALNDIASCMACHEDDADRVCQPCHGGR